MDPTFNVCRGLTIHHLVEQDVLPTDLVLRVDGQWSPARETEPLASRFRALRPSPSSGETEVRLAGLTVIDRGHDPIETAVRIGLTACAVVVGVKVGVALGNALVRA